MHIFIYSINKVYLLTLRTDSLDKHLLCRKGKKDCKNITMLEENPNKWLFVILNIGPQAMNMKYECEFTVQINDLDFTEKGTPTILLPGMFKTFG